MSLSSSPLITVALSVSTFSIAVCAPLVLAPSAANAAADLCHQVTAAEVSGALGVKVTAVTPVHNANITVCWYKVGTNANAIYVRSSIGSGDAGFALNRSRSQGEHLASDKHFAPYSAFSIWLGAASYGYTYGVVILKNKNELDVGGVATSLAKIEGLAKKVLPLI